MTTGATGQLGLALPVQGELSGTWGDTVNNGITQYTNIAIAGTLTLTGDGAVTLANTTGDASASNITSTLAGAGTVTAQFSTVRVSGTTVAKTVTGPSYSKSYLIDNASSYTVTFKAAGQTGVSISPNEKVYVYYNATDYVKVGGGGITYGAVKTTTYTAVANDGVLTNTTSAAFTVNLPATPSTGTQVFIADSAGTWATNNLTIGRNGSTIAGSATDLVCDINSVSIQCIYDGTTWDIFAQIGANDTAVVTLNGTQTLTNKTLTAPVLTAPVLGTPASGTVTNLTGTASININGTVGATTPSTGAFTTLSATGNVTLGDASTDTLNVGNGGLVKDASGNVGIGTSSPTTRLHLSQSNAGDYASVILLSNSANAGADRTGIYGSAAPGNASPYRGGITFHPGASGAVSIHTGNNAAPSTGQTAYFANDLTAKFTASISVGAATPSASGAGITFPATQSASSDANTLDDYEEGTWTPSCTFSSSNGNLTFAGDTKGTYVKIGKMVNIIGLLRFTESTASGDLAITGLPFASISTTSNYAAGTIYADRLTGVSGQIQFLIGGGVPTTEIYPYYSGTGSRTRITNSNTGTDTDFAFAICYQTA